MEQTGIAENKPSLGNTLGFFVGSAAAVTISDPTSDIYDSKWLISGGILTVWVLLTLLAWYVAKKSKVVWLVSGLIYLIVFIFGSIQIKSE